MKIEIGDIVETSKNHPCGSKRFEIKRAGMDFRMKCFGCNTEIWISRVNLEKRIRKIIKNE